MDLFNAFLAQAKWTVAIRCLIALLLLNLVLGTALARAQTAPLPVPSAAPYAAPTAVPYAAPTAVPYTAPTAAPFAVQPASPFAMQVQGPYTIHADDQLQVQVFGTQGLYSVPGQNGQLSTNTIAALSQTVTVLSDGTVNFPLIGSITVAGLQPDTAAHHISDALTAFVIHPIVSVEVMKATTEKIEVLGSVEHGGEYELQRGDRLVDLLVKAGIGPQAFADLNHITLNRVVDGIPRLYNVNLYNMLLNADYSSNPVLQSGDVVYIPKAKQHNAADFLNIPFALYYFHLLAVPGAAGVIP